MEPTALALARRYFDAWTGGRLEEALVLLAEDVVCEAPAGRIEGREAYRDFLEPFTRILLRAELVAAFGDETIALIMYDTETRPVPRAPGAECLTVSGGRIVHVRFLFDRAPFDAARAAAVPR